MSQLSPYQRLGGEPVLRSLVDQFYDLMDSLPEAAGIRALHPQGLATSRDKLFMFLSGWLGGPPLYEEAYGHPRLRARHLPFTIGESERDAWMLCMEQALGQVFVDKNINDRLLYDHLLQSLRNVADHMRNQ
jgi:hemoglobin